MKASLFVIALLACNALAQTKPAGVVLDDAAATFAGDWVVSRRQSSLLGESYRHDDNKGQGTKSARFTTKIPAAGDYEVRLLYVATSNRATKVPVTIHASGKDHRVTINQRQDALVDGVPRALGVFTFTADEEVSVTVSNDGADGFVVVDGLQIIPVVIAQSERRGEKPSGFVSASKPEAKSAAHHDGAALVAVSPLAKTTQPRREPLGADDEPVHLAGNAKPEAVKDREFDLVIVGATGSGVACAVRAAREGCNVLLVQHNAHIGGMMSNGLMQWDALYGGPRAPLFTELLGNIEKHYIARFGKDSKEHQTIRYTHEHYPVGWAEPHVAEHEFNRLVASEKNIALLLSHYPVSVERDGATIKSVTLREHGTTKDVRVRGVTFADATYEGDLFALAKVPYRVGREARDEYHEPHAGKVFANIAKGPAENVAAEKLNIRSYGSHQGTIDETSPFTADGAVQAYNYRFCVSHDPANRVLPEKPANYNREEFLHYDRKSISTNAGPDSKSHMNSPILPGENHGYPEATWPEREKIIVRHRDFALGLMWFLQNDESLSPKQRESFREWGLTKDEFADHDHIPYEMYVREARRIVGRHVLTEQDNSLSKDYARTPIMPDSIAITDWYMDSHSCTTESRPGFHYDGKLILTEESRPAQIPYRSLLPQGVDNLLVPVCLGATHIAWGAVRLEPVWMQTGEAAGFAAALAKKEKTSVAALNPDLLVRTLAESRQMVSFFNDIKVTGAESWIPAVEYLGTKGFFAGYDARAAGPLDKGTARLWAAAAKQMKNGKADAQALARTVSGEETKDVIGSREFLSLLDLPQSDDHPVTRGEACETIFRWLAQP